eukprot:4429089-Prymnesium_polylepis.1
MQGPCAHWLGGGRSSRRPVRSTVTRKRRAGRNPGGFGPFLRRHTYRPGCVRKSPPRGTHIYQPFLTL